MPSGAERLDRFMARANAAYYATHDPFADFTTAPEISQAFGEILGLWAAVIWRRWARPIPVLLAEAGPGRGTLMADALRAIAQCRAGISRALFRAASDRDIARDCARCRRKSLPEATWHDESRDLSRGPAAAARQRVPRRAADPAVRAAATTGWTERYVADGSFVEQPPRADATPAAPSHRGRGWTASAMIELCEPALRFRRGDSAHGSPPTRGAALLLDYGPDRQRRRGQPASDPRRPAGRSARRCRAAPT